jgi:hypothetical protein
MIRLHVASSKNPHGILAFCVKSAQDPLYGKGTRVAPDMYSLDGHVRHFFSREYATDLLRAWEILRMTECFGGYLDSSAQSGLLQVIARNRMSESLGVRWRRGGSLDH